MKTFEIYFRYWLLRIIYITLGLLILFGSYFFSVPQVYIGNNELINPIYNYISDTSTWLYCVDYFIFIFLISILLILIWIIYYNLKKNIKGRTNKIFLDSFISKLFYYIFFVDEFTNDEEQIKIAALKKELNNDHSKRLFMNTLKNIHSQTTGKVHEKAAQIMIAVDFNKLIFAYLHSPYFKHKLFALNIISSFQLEGYDKYILKLTKSKNNILHTEAIVSLLKLKVYENLHFLVDFNMKLTQWDINIIIKTVQTLNLTHIDYYLLIKSEVSEISALGIMLARINKCYEYKALIKQNIGNSNKLINDEAFMAYISFSINQEDYDFLIDNFEEASLKAKQKIIKSLVNSDNTSKIIIFLNWVVENKHFTLKVEAIRLLLVMELEFNLIASYKKSKNLSIRSSCLQVLDINL